MSDLIRSQVKSASEGSGRGCGLHSALSLEEMPKPESLNIEGWEDKILTQVKRRSDG